MRKSERVLSYADDRGAVSQEAISRYLNGLLERGGRDMTDVPALAETVRNTFYLTRDSDATASVLHWMARVITA